MTTSNSTTWGVAFRRLCLALSCSYATISNATIVPSFSECQTVEQSGGVCLALPKGADMIWCASPASGISDVVTVARVMPTSVSQGSTLDLLITAQTAHFSPDSQVKIQGVTVNKVTPLSPSQLQVNVTVSPTATPDIYDLLVETNGEIAQGACLLEVVEANDQPPVDITLSNQTVDNDTSSRGTVIGAFATTDVDAKDTHTYYLIDDSSEYFGIDGDQLEVVTDTPMAVGNYHIKVLSVDSQGLTVLKTFSIDVTGSSDEDGIADSTEDKAPNGGDGNDDGTSDRQQSFVTSLPFNGSQYLTVEARNSDCAFHKVKIVGEEELSPDPVNDFPYDLVSFELACSSATQVNLYYHGNNSSSDWLVRSYETLSQQWNDAYQATVENVSVNGNRVLKVSVPLAGGEDGYNPQIALGLTSNKKSQIQFGSGEDTMMVEEFGEATTIDDQSGNFIRIPVTRTVSSKGMVEVTYTIADGTAVAGKDYYSPQLTGNLTWEDGEDFPLSIPLLILDDEEEEGAESLQVTLTGLRGDGEKAELGDVVQLTVTINDNEGQTECKPNPQAALVPSAKEVTLTAGGLPVIFSLTGGQGDLEIQELPNSDIVKVLLDTQGGTPEVTLVPVQTGDTQLTIADCANSQSVIHVMVQSAEAAEAAAESAMAEESLTSETTCLEDPSLALKPAFQEVTLALEESPITLTLTGGQQDRQLSKTPDNTIVTMDTPEFPDSGGASVTLTPRTLGTTELTVSDCYSQASVMVTVVKQHCQTDPEVMLQPALQNVLLLLDDEPQTIYFTGGQGDRSLSTIPDNGIVAMAPPLFPETGGASVTLTPKSVGETTLAISDDCQDFAVANIRVVKPKTLAYYCAMAKKSDDICQSPDGGIELVNTALGQDAQENVMETTAQFIYRGIKENRVMLDTLPNLVVNVFTDPLHVGKPASLLMVAATETKNIVYDGSAWQSIPGKPDELIDISSLPTFLEYPSLPSLLELTEELRQPFSTFMTNGEGVEIHLGYRLSTEEGSTVHNWYWPLIVIGPNSAYLSAEAVTQEPPATRFRVRLTTAAGLEGQDFTTEASEPVTVSFKIYVDSKHVGQPAELLVVAGYYADPTNLSAVPQLLGYDGLARRWVPTPLETIGTVAADHKIDSLPEIAQGEFQVLPSELFAALGNTPASDSKIEIYLAYRLGNGEVVYLQPPKARGWFVKGSSVTP